MKSDTQKFLLGAIVGVLLSILTYINFPLVHNIDDKIKLTMTQEMDR